MIFVKTGDQYPVTFTANADLTDASVRLLASLNGAVSVELACTVTDAVGGVITHVLDGTLAAGTYRVEAEMSRGGEVVTFPTGSNTAPPYETLVVVQDLG